MDNIVDIYGNTHHVHSHKSGCSFVLGRAAVTDYDIKLQKILSNPIFHKLEDCTSEERSQQAYKALKLLIKSFPLSREDILFAGEALGSVERHRVFPLDRHPCQPYKRLSSGTGAPRHGVSTAGAHAEGFAE